MRKILEIRTMPAKFFEHDVSAKLRNKRNLSTYLDGLTTKHLKKLKKANLTYIFCTDDYLLQINQEFLKHKTLTDIVTFDLSETSEELVGEIYISVDRVKENAEKFGVTYDNELHRVIFHGALHLCGYKDKNEEDQKKMRRKEDACLKEYLKPTDAPL